MSFKFQKTNALIALTIFIIEIVIARYATGFLRHFIGDVLVTLLLFFTLKSFFTFRNDFLLVSSIFIFSLTIELLQLFQLPNKLGITNEVVLIVLGKTFDILDILAYAIGCCIMILMIKLKWV